MKKCGKCQKILTLDNFAKNKARYDGLQNYCRVCGYESGKKYAQANREKAVLRSQKWQKANSEKHKTSYAIYYARTLDYQKKRNATYLANNLERHAKQQYLRRLKIKNNGVFSISKKELKKLYTLPCFYCGKFAPITLDHITPVSRGGRHSIGNLVSACRSCNSSKNDRFITEWRKSKNVLADC